MNDVKKILILLLVVISGCREKYVPTLNEPVTGYLVVDGFINSGTGPTTISLSRTAKLSSNVPIQRETRALVRVEAKSNGTSFVLTETPALSGTYTNPQLTLTASEQYRVYIKTSAGKEYVSDYSSVRKTPDLDSIAWRKESDGVRLYGNTHNTQEPVGYYQFKFEETWEIHSPFGTRLKIYNDAKGAPHHVGFKDSTSFSDDLSLFMCWKTDTSKTILVTSTAKLTQNSVPMFPLQFIENNSWKLDVRYSMLAKLYSISREGLQFLEQLKKNTEQLGSIFDPQPSDNNGNIHCLSNPSEIAIGFIDVTEEKTKRIFINRQQVDPWYYRTGCVEETFINTPEGAVSAGGRIPTQVSKMSIFGSIDSFAAAAPICVDCTLRGTNKKPTFW